jgi:hypothetical protein
MGLPVGLNWLRKKDPMAQYCKHGSEVSDFTKMNLIISRATMSF